MEVFFSFRTDASAIHIVIRSGRTKATVHTLSAWRFAIDRQTLVNVNNGCLPRRKSASMCRYVALQSRNNARAPSRPIDFNGSRNNINTQDRGDGEREGDVFNWRTTVRPAPSSHRLIHTLHNADKRRPRPEGRRVEGLFHALCAPLLTAPPACSLKSYLRRVQREIVRYTRARFSAFQFDVDNSVLLRSVLHRGARKTAGLRSLFSSLA